MDERVVVVVVTVATSVHHSEGQVLGSQMNRDQGKTPQEHVVKELSKPIPGIL